MSKLNSHLKILPKASEMFQNFMDSLKHATPALHEKIVQECARIAESDVNITRAHVQNTSTTHSESAVDGSDPGGVSNTITRSDMSSTAVISTAPSAVHVTSLSESVGAETGHAVSSSTETDTAIPDAPCPATSGILELEVDHTRTLVGIETAAAKEGDKDDAKDVAANVPSHMRKRCVHFKQ